MSIQVKYGLKALDPGKYTFNAMIVKDSFLNSPKSNTLGYTIYKVLSKGTTLILKQKLSAASGSDSIGMDLSDFYFNTYPYAVKSYSDMQASNEGAKFGGTLVTDEQGTWKDPGFRIIQLTEDFTFDPSDWSTFQQEFGPEEIKDVEYKRWGAYVPPKNFFSPSLTFSDVGKSREYSIDCTFNLRTTDGSILGPFDKIKIQDSVEGYNDQGQLVTTRYQKVYIYSQNSYELVYTATDTDKGTWMYDNEQIQAFDLEDNVCYINNILDYTEKWELLFSERPKTD